MVIDLLAGTASATITISQEIRDNEEAVFSWVSENDAPVLNIRFRLRELRDLDSNGDFLGVDENVLWIDLLDDDPVAICGPGPVGLRFSCTLSLAANGENLVVWRNDSELHYVSNWSLEVFHESDVGPLSTLTVGVRITSADEVRSDSDPGFRGLRRQHNCSSVQPDGADCPFFGPPGPGQDENISLHDGVQDVTHTQDTALLSTQHLLHDDFALPGNLTKHNDTMTVGHEGVSLDGGGPERGVALLLPVMAVLWWPRRTKR